MTMRITSTQHTSFLIAAASAVLLVACGGGGSGGGNAHGASVDLLVTDAPVDDLLAFSGRVQALRLEKQGGGTTDDLLGASVDVEFLGLQNVLRWLATADIAPGTYSGVELEFEHGSYFARAMDGSDVSIDSTDDTLRVPFTTALSIESDDYRRISLDLDLSASLQGSLPGPLSFTPHGTADDDDGSTEAEVDEFKGRVTSVDPALGTLVVDAFVDDDLSIGLGPVTVLVGPLTLLLGDDDQPFASRAAFFAALHPGQSVVEVHGNLGSAGRVNATRIDLENQRGGAGDDLVKIEGRVVNLAPGVSFGLMIREIDEGASIAGPVLASLGHPSTITVSFDATTVFLLEEHLPATSANLAIGQAVKVKFTSFVSSPFQAARVEIEDEDADFEGWVSGTSGQPDSLVMHVNPSEPAVQSGAIASGTTDVSVQLAGAALFLDTPGHPALSLADLRVGLKIEVKGALAGTPGAPSISATSVKVHPGKLHATVLHVFPPSSFSTTGGEIEDPFGGAITPGPLDVQLASGAVFTGDALSAASFFQLFGQLGAGQVLRVRVEGLATGAADEVIAYAVEVEIDD